MNHKRYRECNTNSIGNFNGRYGNETGTILEPTARGIGNNKKRYMARRNYIPVHKVKIIHPQTKELGWTFRVQSSGTESVEEVAEQIGRRLLVEPRVAALIFDQLAREMINRIQMGFSIDMGVLGYLHPKIKDAGWVKREEDMNLHGTSGFLSWEPSKKTKRAFYDVGCTLDWVQRSRNRQRGVKDDDDDDDFDDDRYPLDLNDESF